MQHRDTGGGKPYSSAHVSQVRKCHVGSNNTCSASSMGVLLGVQWLQIYVAVLVIEVTAFVLSSKGTSCPTRGLEG